MTDARALILFTTAYPFGSGEPFLDAELPFLAEAFRRVVVVPTLAPGLPRPMPGGVQLDVGLAESRPGKLAILASGAWGALSSAACRREIAAERAPRSHWRALERAVRYWGDAERTRDWVIAALAARGWAPETVVGYSYWLGRQTLGLGLAKAALPGLVVASRAHGSDMYAAAHRPPYLPFRADTIGACDRIFTVSSHGLGHLAATHPGMADRLEVARLGTPPPPGRSPASRDGVFRIASCSFVTPIKRLDKLVDALAVLAGRHPAGAIAWHHVGDGPERAALERRAAQALGHRVTTTFHGHVPAGRVTAFYAATPLDAFVNVSDSEGVPVSLMEAMSCGLPVLAPAIGGIPELVTAGAGVLLPPRPEVGAIADGLEALWASGAHRREAAHAAWHSAWRAEANYRAFAGRLAALGTEGLSADARGA
jgi:glycosyltransferase involved in cell wall biosynthesis